MNFLTFLYVYIGINAFIASYMLWLVSYTHKNALLYFCVILGCLWFGPIVVIARLIYRVHMYFKLTERSIIDNAIVDELGRVPTYSSYILSVDSEFFNAMVEHSIHSFILPCARQPAANDRLEVREIVVFGQSKRKDTFVIENVVAFPGLDENFCFVTCSKNHHL